jgi:carbamoyltransferase
MKILGISAHYHDSAAALVIDGVPACAVQEERLSRRKNDAAFPLGAIEWCLDHAGLEPADLDAVVFYERSMRKFDRILTSALRTFPRSWRSFPHAIKNSLGEKVWVRGIISSQLGVPRSKILFTGHHQSHAAAGFLTAPTSRAAILTADGVGEWATLTVGQGERCPGRGASITLRREIRYPHSLGMLYSTFTAFLGFAVNEEEYKVMGLAAYGRPTMTDAVRKLIRRTPDGAFALDLKYFEYQTTARQSYSPRFVELFGRPRNPYEPIDLETADGRRFADCAASVQEVLEDTLVDITRALHRETGLPDLCLSGGVALNGVANARILAESGFERVFVPSAPGDAGCALGAALYADRVCLGNPDRDVPDHPFWGPDVDSRELAQAAREDDQVVEELDEAVLIERIADQLAAGRIVGWMDGASEFGPRALGHRSILPRRTRARCAIGSIGTSSIERNSGRSPRWRPPRRPTGISICHPEGRGWPASCRASSRCGPSGVRGSPRSRTWTVLRGSRRSSAGWRRGFISCSRRTDAAPAFRCCSTPRSMWRENRSSTARSRGTRHSGAAGSTRSSQDRRS